MKKGLKRILSAFLSLVIVFGLLSCLPVSSFAVTSGYYEYSVNENSTVYAGDAVIFSRYDAGLISQIGY